MKRAVELMKLQVEELLRRFQNPDRLLGLLIEDHKRMLSEATSSCALLVAVDKRLETSIETHHRSVREAEAEARRAMDQGSERLARLALLRKIEHRHAAQRQQAELLQLREESRRMSRELEELSAVLEEAQRKRDLLRARRDARKALPGLRREPSPDGPTARVLGLEGPGPSGQTRTAMDSQIEAAFRALEREEELERELETLQSREEAGEDGRKAQ